MLGRLSDPKTELEQYLPSSPFSLPEQAAMRLTLSDLLPAEILQEIGLLQLHIGGSGNAVILRPDIANDRDTSHTIGVADIESFRVLTWSS